MWTVELHEAGVQNNSAHILVLLRAKRAGYGQQGACQCPRGSGVQSMRNMSDSQFDVKWVSP